MSQKVADFCSQGWRSPNLDPFNQLSEAGALWNQLGVWSFQRLETGTFPPVETGETARKGVGYQEKNILNFRWNLRKKKKKMGEKSTDVFCWFFLGGEEDLSNFAGAMLLCCYNRILIQSSKFLRFLFHIFVAQGEVRVVHSSKKSCSEFSKCNRFPG